MFLTPAAAAVAGADTAAPLGSSKRPRKLPSMEIREAHHLRDTGMVYYLFDTGQRVGEGPRIRLCDIEPHPLTWARGVVPESVLIKPNGHKTCQQRNAGQATLWSVDRPAAQTRASEFLWLLPRLMAASAAAGVPLQADSPIFLQLTGGGYRLSPKAATYEVAKRIVVRRSAQCGLARQVLTGHSSRRGRIQEDQAYDIADDVTRSRLLGICAHTLKLYRSLTRPTRCLEAPVELDAVPLTPPSAASVPAAGLMHRALAWFNRV